jgi:hypothetical protein
MNILTPLTITADMIAAGTTVAEPAPGETAWVSGAAYAVGDRRIRTSTHMVYACVQAHSGRTALPEVDGAYWLAEGPTQRWAPFDQYSSTAATGATSMTYVLQPGYFNAVALFGLTGTAVSVTVRDAPGGTVVFAREASLYDDPAGWWEFLFLPAKAISKLLLTGIPIRPAAELTITVTGSAVGIGMIAVGDYRSLISEGGFGGTMRGASAEPVTYSYIKTDDDGTTRIKRRSRATSMRASVFLPRRDADYALASIQEVLDVPVVWVATDTAGFDGLSVFGLGSASVIYESAEHARINLVIKGMI